MVQRHDYNVTISLTSYSKYKEYKLFFDFQKMIGIYIIKNLINGKTYVGSSTNIEQRWRDHIYCLKNNRHANIHLQNDYNLFGIDVFKFDILKICPTETNNTKDWLYKNEKYFIHQYEKQGISYNITYTDNSQLPRGESKKRRLKARKHDNTKIIDQIMKEHCKEDK